MNDIIIATDAGREGNSSPDGFWKNPDAAAHQAALDFSVTDKAIKDGFAHLRWAGV